MLEKGRKGKGEKERDGRLRPIVIFKNSAPMQ